MENINAQIFKLIFSETAQYLYKYCNVRRHDGVYSCELSLLKKLQFGNKLLQLMKKPKVLQNYKYQYTKYHNMGNQQKNIFICICFIKQNVPNSCNRDFRKQKQTCYKQINNKQNEQ
ncbi:unnamed protein product [Paramecium sonneborni]|uniref:Uncharacterized protein n=1 Tax=Paramecium sonneborni TaxID=65129 RepID=A0A8S1RSJ1_9CILI|nr:unnamed protein product [Paramecium sonneborni]